MQHEQAPVRMRVQRGFLNGRDAIKIMGPFDTISDHLQQFAEEIVHEGKHSLVIDLSETTYMTSPGIACFIKVVKTMQRVNGTIYVHNAKQDMLDLIELANIRKFVTVV